MIHDYPTIIVDNFFKDPHSVRDFALDLEFKSSPEGVFSGKRTESLHKTHEFFFQSVCDKILDCISIPYQNYSANLFFHITEDKFGDTGWVHVDDNNTLAAIVYLNPQCRDINNGTSIYKLDKFKNTRTNRLVGEMRQSFIKEIDNEEAKTCANQNYSETARLGGVFNRLVVYDAKQFHSGNGYFGNTKETSRLTMLVFFQDIIIPGNVTPLQRAERLSRL